MKLQVYQKELN